MPSVCFAKPLPMLTSYVTTVQYQNQEIGIGVKHRAYMYVCARTHVGVCGQLCMKAPQSKHRIFHHH